MFREGDSLASKMRIVALSLFTLSLSACGWSSRDRDNFLTECARTDTKATCECGLQVSQRHFANFDAFYRDRDNFPRSMELELSRECEIAIDSVSDAQTSGSKSGPHPTPLFTPEEIKAFRRSHGLEPKRDR